MIQLLTSHLSTLLWLGAALLTLIGGIGVIKSLIVARRLYHFSTDIIEHDPATFRHLAVMECQACKGTQHVRLHQYGPDEKPKTLYLCYLCVPRLEKEIQGASQAYLAAHPKEQSNHAYKHFTSGRR